MKIFHDVSAKVLAYYSARPATRTHSPVLDEHCHCCHKGHEGLSVVCKAETQSSDTERSMAHANAIQLTNGIKKRLRKEDCFLFVHGCMRWMRKEIFVPISEIVHGNFRL